VLKTFRWLFSGDLAGHAGSGRLFSGWAGGASCRAGCLVPGPIYSSSPTCLVFYALFALGGASLCGGARFLRLGERFQPVRGVAFLESLADCSARSRRHACFGFVSAGGSCGALGARPLYRLLAASAFGYGKICCWCPAVSSGPRASSASTALIRGGRTGAPGWPRFDLRPSRATRSGGNRPGRAIAEIARSPYLLGIVAYVLLYTVLSAFAYLELAGGCPATTANPGQRTALFRADDLAVNK